MEYDSWTGKNLREMFRTGTQLLSSNAAAVNALNVFPVPDGDTGTNMLLTMQSAIAEANVCTDTDASAVAKAMAEGALLGARGNSGVILSQILRGLSEGLDGKRAFTSKDIANALLRASVMADKAVSHPVEGTILTVMREAASAGKQAAAEKSANLEHVIEAAVEEARESVIRTPSLLPVLKESGVVDAGGQGLCIILEGLLCYLQGKDIATEATTELQQRTAIAKMPPEEEYGYCTEFLLQGNDLDLETIRAKLVRMGEHVLVVGDPKTARVHIHTFDPGAALSYAISLGTLHKIKIDNMEEQHREFLATQSVTPPQPVGTISTVAVVTGQGLIEVFKSLGTTHIVPGGETMNPSVKELLEAVESVPTDEVIIIPNNPDILPTARQVCEIAKKKVVVMPSRTIMQGISALVAFNYDSDLKTNLSAMTEAMTSVRTGQIATAMRTMQYNDLRVREGQIIGFVDDELAIAEDTIEETLRKVFERMDSSHAEILTAYYGSDVDWAKAERLFEPIRVQYPNLEVEVIFGGQPHYHYLISVE